MRKLLCVLLLAGCQTTEGRWERAGATDDDWHRDRGQCIAQMESVSFAGNLQKAKVFAGCMQGKGWYWTEQETAQPAVRGPTEPQNSNYRVIQ